MFNTNQATQILRFENSVETDQMASKPADQDPHYYSL